MIIRFIIFCLLFSTAVQAKPIVADISGHKITIHTSFNGTELMLFGARNEAGDIVTIVRGPEKHAIIRKKERLYGLWVNREQRDFDYIPSFYALATSRPFEEIKKSPFFDNLGIGYESALTPKGNRHEFRETSGNGAFLRAMLHHLREEQVYNSQSLPIKFIGETLFKAIIPFPDNTPGGNYTVEVYLFSDGEMVGMQTIPIQVEKVGFDAFVYNASLQYSYLYAICAIMLALFSGWIASRIFERF